MRIGREFKFDSAHFLPGHPTCGAIHGHTWKLKVELEGPIDPKTGMVVDFQKLKYHVDTSALYHLDHRLLNDILGNIIPTCENLASWIANELAPSIPEPITTLIVTVQEGGGGWAQYELTLR